MRNVHDRSLLNTEFPFASKPSDADKIKDYFDDAIRIIKESGFISLMSTFEEIAITWLNTTAGECRSVIEKHYKIGIGNKQAHRLVSNPTLDRWNLKKVNEIVGSDLAPGDRERLLSFVKYRNYIAHGKKQNEKAQDVLTGSSLEGVAIFLDEVLKKIKPGD
ncbi:MAG: hypothetical protein NUW37_03675 [Planctomycetes bacterium]|nr:hypothetical protein [Planctomycetota bacterium]